MLVIVHFRSAGVGNIQFKASRMLDSEGLSLYYCLLSVEAAAHSALLVCMLFEMSLRTAESLHLFLSFAETFSI